MFPVGALLPRRTQSMFDEGRSARRISFCTGGLPLLRHFVSHNTTALELAQDRAEHCPESIQGFDSSQKNGFAQHLLENDPVCLSSCLIRAFAIVNQPMHLSAPTTVLPTYVWR